jgi:hypothetical protein
MGSLKRENLIHIHKHPFTTNRNVKTMTKFNFNRDRVSSSLLRAALALIKDDEYENGQPIAAVLEAAVPEKEDRGVFFTHNETFEEVVEDLHDGAGTHSKVDCRIAEVIEYLETPPAPTPSYALVEVESVQGIRNSIAAALAGESVRGRYSTGADGCGFYWDTTDQGQDYWADRFGCRDAETPTDLSLTDLQFLQGLIDYNTAQD